MPYTAHMRVFNTDKKLAKVNGGKTPGMGTSKNYSSILPSVYQGLPDRLDRYQQYDMMEQDPQINTSLNVLSDFMTQNKEDDASNPFYINYKDSAPDIEVDTTNKLLDKWCELQDFENRIYDIVRNTIKYGDNVFIRDPETYILEQVDMYDVEKVVVNEEKGKDPEVYVIKDLSINLQNKSVTKEMENQDSYSSFANLYGQSNVSSVGAPSTVSGSSVSGATGQGGSFGAEKTTATPVDAKHIVHLSLNTGGGATWPFGVSMLENVYKVYKQKELLEDAIIIYRVQRAPERRVFKIDTGSMPPHKSQEFVERIKNEIHQKRLPTRDGDGNFSLMDATYNPLSMLEDYFFPTSSDGRGSSVDTLPGGDNLGQIDDLRYFNNELIRGLGIPASYIPFGPDEGGTSYNDGKVGQMLVQEHRFLKNCQRIQSVIIKEFDKEFKWYINELGFKIDTSSFNVRFNPPMNFTEWTYMELQQTRMGLFLQASDIPYISKRMAMQEFLGWDETKIAKNAELWMQENPSKLKSIKVNGVDEQEREQAPGLRSVGIPNVSDADGLGGIEGGAGGGDTGGSFGGADLGGADSPMDSSAPSLDGGADDDGGDEEIDTPDGDL